MLRATELQKRGQSCIAVLGLTAADVNVPRTFLRERLRRVLAKFLCKIAEAFLIPSWISTVGDPKEDGL